VVARHTSYSASDASPWLRSTRNACRELAQLAVVSVICLSKLILLCSVSPNSLMLGCRIYVHCWWGKRCTRALSTKYYFSRFVTVQSQITFFRPLLDVIHLHVAWWWHHLSQTLFDKTVWTYESEYTIHTFCPNGHVVAFGKRGKWFAKPFWPCLESVWAPLATTTGRQTNAPVLRFA